jgi:hypothetical protein
VNDTTREVGGAIGIALVGSIVTSVYRDQLSPTLDALPPELADVARDNVGKALAVAEGAADAIGPDAAAQLTRDVRQAFVDGAHVGLRVAAAFVAAAGIVIYVRLGKDPTSAAPSAPLEPSDGAGVQPDH